MFKLVKVVQSLNTAPFLVFGDGNACIYISESLFGEENLSMTEKFLQLPDESIDRAVSVLNQKRTTLPFSGPLDIPLSEEEAQKFIDGRVLCRTVKNDDYNVGIVYVKFLSDEEKEFIQSFIDKMHYIIYEELWGRFGLEMLQSVSFSFPVLGEIINNVSLNVTCCSIFSNEYLESLIKKFQLFMDRDEISLSIVDGLLGVSINSVCGKTMDNDNLRKIISDFVLNNSAYNTVRLIYISGDGELAINNIQTSDSRYTLSTSSTLKNDIEQYIKAWENDFGNSSISEVIEPGSPTFHLYIINRRNETLDACKRFSIKWEIPCKKRGRITDDMVEKFINENRNEILSEMYFATERELDTYHLSKINAVMHENTLLIYLDFYFMIEDYGDLPF